ncbi:hypothetical protein KP509_24G048700 [Ceratopteris richardii]|uniref:Chromo domain-containing protein n=1 Tax=Ceratopteris richardii TaxID=49495 RepID=A0A8T2RUT6_CERRI|nr:hypothetical protein KP509_24G048700 [Ceratopteris richardii]
MEMFPQPSSSQPPTAANQNQPMEEMTTSIPTDMHRQRPEGIPEPSQHTEGSLVAALRQELLEVRKEVMALRSTHSTHSAVAMTTLPPQFLPEPFRGDTKECEEGVISDWLSKWTGFFNMYGLVEAQRIGHLQLMLKGRAYSWWVALKPQPTTWEEFQKVFRAHFVRDDKMEAYRRLFRCKMGKRSLDAYSQEFRDLIQRTKALEEPQAWLQMLYLFGLPPAYKNEVLRNPIGSLEDIYRFARNYDSTLAISRGDKGKELPTPSHFGKVKLFSPPPSAAAQSKGLPRKEVSIDSTFRALRLEDRSKGRCYECHQTGHVHRDPVCIVRKRKKTSSSDIRTTNTAVNVVNPGMYSLDSEIFQGEIKGKTETIQTGSCTKLSSRYCGPFQITRKITEVSYELELARGITIHPVFHEIPNLEDIVQYIPLELDIVLDQREKRSRRTSYLEYLIKWKHKHESAATWESVRSLKSCFPGFIHEEIAEDSNEQ